MAHDDNTKTLIALTKGDLRDLRTATRKTVRAGGDGPFIERLRTLETKLQAAEALLNRIIAEHANAKGA